MRRETRAKRTFSRILSAAMIFVLLTGTLGFNSQAAEVDNLSDAIEETEVEVLEATIIENPVWPSDIMPYTMLVDCMISVGGDDEGMHIDVITGAVGTASVIGVKDIKIYKKNWYGGWTLVATSNGGETYNHSISGVSILYKNAVKDATYKITCVHYADVNGYEENAHDSGAFVYSFYQ